jgi:nucleotide-binding universal stress UspA family protein
MTASTSRILVAIEASAAAAEAVRQAHAHAELVSGTLGVCHVLTSLRIHALLPHGYAPEAVDNPALEERVRTLVGESVTAATGRHPSSFEIFIEKGTDYVEIVRRGEAWRANLIVVGHGHKRGFIGGVAEKVVRYAHCPVLVARPPAVRGLVIAATDLSEASLPAIEAAATEAHLRGAKLAVLHVVDQGVPLGSVGPSIGMTPLVLAPEMLHDLQEIARVRIEAVLAQHDAQAEITIVDGRAGPTILRYIEEHPSELVVVGTRGWTGFARVALGSVAEHIVRAAETSVLVVRLSD